MTILAVGLSAGAGLAVVLVGIVLLLATVFALRAMAAVERLLARRLLQIGIHPRSRPGSTSRGASASSCGCATP